MGKAIGEAQMMVDSYVLHPSECAISASNRQP
jgi:hypothetical protein